MYVCTNWVSHSYTYTCLQFHLTDINECTDGTHNCDLICTNTVGSFICGCDIGYLLNTDEITCDGTDYKSFVHTYA